MVSRCRISWESRSRAAICWRTVLQLRTIPMPVAWKAWIIWLAWIPARTPFRSTTSSSRTLVGPIGRTRVVRPTAWVQPSRALSSVSALAKEQAGKFSQWISNGVHGGLADFWIGTAGGFMDHVLGTNLEPCGRGSSQLDRIAV